ncbi:MAG: hypothetical protein ABR499_05135 [Gemmatimonadaceae bacterium]
MRTAPMFTLLSLAQITLLVACGTEPAQRVLAPSADVAARSQHGDDGDGQDDERPRFGDWSAPVNLGPPINTPVADGNPVLAPDGLSLYYDSDRTDLPGALGARDIWVARRACTDHLDPQCAWQTPVNLGPRINTPYVDGSPEISDDGHLLFFLSHTTREDCPLDPVEPDPTRPCDEDIYVSWRSDPTDDLAWSEPVRLGPEVNTAVGEGEPDYLRNAEPGRGNLYFSRAVGGTARGFDIYYARLRITRRGHPSGVVVEVLDPAVPVGALNVPDALDGGVTIRADGRELFFQSGAQRPQQGRVGGLDMWTSTRRNPHDPWSEPVNLGAPLNSPRADLAPSLSHDGRTLVFTSNRQGPTTSVGWDIYMSTRTPSGR